MVKSFQCLGGEEHLARVGIGNSTELCLKIQLNPGPHRSIPVLENPDLERCYIGDDFWFGHDRAILNLIIEQPQNQIGRLADLFLLEMLKMRSACP